jgi:hypothetical protein
LLSRATFPLSSKISAVRYSRTAAIYTGEPELIRLAYPPSRRYRLIRPTGNCRPAFDELDVGIAVLIQVPMAMQQLDRRCCRFEVATHPQGSLVWRRDGFVAERARLEHTRTRRR